MLTQKLQTETSQHSSALGLLLFVFPAVQVHSVSKSSAAVINRFSLKEQYKFRVKFVCCGSPHNSASAYLADELVGLLKELGDVLLSIIIDANDLVFEMLPMEAGNDR